MKLRNFYHRLFRTRARSRLAVLKRMPRRAICAEIGVWKGDFSRLILRHTRPRKLFLVDCWQYQPEFDIETPDQPEERQQMFDAMYANVRDNLGSLDNVEVIRAFSEAAVERIPDGCLDWIYLDANHFYAQVRQDLRLWHPKIRPGGYICGDDYDWGASRGHPVRRAVEEFVAEGIAMPVAVFRSQYILRVPDVT